MRAVVPAASLECRNIVFNDGIDQDGEAGKVVPTTPTVGLVTAD